MDSEGRKAELVARLREILLEEASQLGPEPDQPGRGDDSLGT